VGGEHAPAIFIHRAEYGGAGAVTEQHGRVAATRRFVEPARVHFGADQQNVPVLAGADPRVGDRKPVDETAALIADVDGGISVRPSSRCRKTPLPGSK